MHVGGFCFPIVVRLSSLDCMLDLTGSGDVVSPRVEGAGKVTQRDILNVSTVTIDLRSCMLSTVTIDLTNI